jgi:hypothetical protein
MFQVSATVDGVVKILHLLRCHKVLSLRRTLVRRNDKTFARLSYEVFYLAIMKCDFLRNYDG